MSDILEQLVIYEADVSKADSVVTLFCEDKDNQYNWNVEKWTHYYVDYPEGKPVSLVAEINGEVVGHYGLLPIQIGSYSAMMGMHAYVSEKFRGLTIISELMRRVDTICKERSISLICGFANPQFTLILKTFFKWKNPVWLSVKKGIKPGNLIRSNEKFYFKYSDSWSHWRFGEKKDVYISRYQDENGKEHKQLLKLNISSDTLGNIDMQDIENWLPGSKKSEKQHFSQPFTIKLYDQSLIEKGVLEPQNWFIEMGDSDTFIYTPWS